MGSGEVNYNRDNDESHIYIHGCSKRKLYSRRYFPSLFVMFLALSFYIYTYPDLVLSITVIRQVIEQVIQPVIEPVIRPEIQPEILIEGLKNAVQTLTLEDNVELLTELKHNVELLTALNPEEPGPRKPGLLKVVLLLAALHHKYDQKLGRAVQWDVEMEKAAQQLKQTSTLEESLNCVKLGILTLKQKHKFEEALNLLKEVKLLKDVKEAILQLKTEEHIKVLTKAKEKYDQDFQQKIEKKIETLKKAKEKYDQNFQQKIETLKDFQRFMSPLISEIRSTGD